MFWKKRQERQLGETFAEMVRGHRRRLRERQEEARFDSERQEQYWIENGLLDPDQPTPQAHARHVERMEAEFTPLERRLIRYSLGL